MIHEALEVFYVRERNARKKRFNTIVRKKLKDILEQNFPRISSLTIRIDDITHFLMFYCKETFKKVFYHSLKTQVMILYQIWA